jgi:hypothetical protein
MIEMTWSTTALHEMSMAVIGMSLSHPCFAFILHSGIYETVHYTPWCSLVRRLGRREPNDRPFPGYYGLLVQALL